MNADMIVDRVNGFLRIASYKRTTINYDMNAIKIRLYDEADLQTYMFYIYSPWRLVHNDVLINSSGLYPSDYLYESKEDHRNAFNKFCETTRDLETQRIRRIEVKPKSNDLTIEWESGHLLEKFCVDEKWDYHIYDRLNSHDLGFNVYAAAAAAHGNDSVETRANRKN